MESLPKRIIRTTLAALGLVCIVIVVTAAFNGTFGQIMQIFTLGAFSALALCALAQWLIESK